MTIMSFRGKDAELLMPALREVEVKRMKFDGAVDHIKKSELTPVADSKKGTIVTTGRNKYGAKKTMYRNCLYHSKKEAEFAMELDSELLKKKIAGWHRQVDLNIKVNGIHVCKAVVDFLVIHLDGSKEYVEVKGYATDVWKLKRKLVAAVYPDIKYTVR